MTPNHDHGRLFVAPSPPPGTEADRGQYPIVDDGAEAMRRLRHPFAVLQPTAADIAQASPAV